MGERLQDPKGEEMNDIPDRCNLCGGELGPGKTTLEIWHGEGIAHY